jgi:deferrochelatase/peroxidase EfeB
VSFGFNGSYLVLRKLEQRVDAFRSFLDHAERHGVSRELCAAKLIGRWPDGAALALHPDHAPEYPKPEGRFSYAEVDALGHACPLGAHVRRAHPRDTRTLDERENERHRLLRRGRLYGPGRDESNDAAERGLLFLALNADLGRQFEHVQSRLLASQPGVAVRAEMDALLGTSGANDGGLRHFTIPAEPVRKRLFGLPDLVRARGGLYGFLPSLRALGYLADLAEARALP